MMTTRFLKIALILFLISYSTKVKCEIIRVKIFFDEKWVICQPVKAAFYRECGWDKDINFYEGTFTDYLMNGTKLQTGHYSNGVKEGVFISYYKNGNEKIKTYFKNNLPDSVWIYYYPNKKIQYKLNFLKDNFNIAEFNDSSGVSKLYYTSKFIYKFPDNSLGEGVKITGMLETNHKQGKWKVYNGQQELGYDIYRKDVYIKSVFSDKDTTHKNERVLKNTMFIPNTVYAAEKLKFYDDISDKDYPFFTLLFPWKPIDIAYGIIGDSSIFQIDAKPMYYGGLEGLNESILNGVYKNISDLENCKTFGYVYYELTIDEKGVLIEKKIVKSPDKILSDMTLQSLSYLKFFKPAYTNGNPIKSKFTARVKFNKPTLIEPPVNQANKPSTLISYIVPDSICNKNIAYTNAPIIDTNAFKNKIKLPKWRYGLNIGYSSRLTKISDEPTNILNSFMKNFSSGYCIKGDYYYFISKSFGLGLRSSFFLDRNQEKNISYTNTQGQNSTGLMKQTISIFHIGPSVITRVFSLDAKNGFLVGLTVGYDFYKDKTIITYPYTIRGNNWGFVYDFGYDRKLNEKLTLSLSISYVRSKLSKFTIYENSKLMGGYLSKENAESISRMEFTVGLKFTK